MNYKTKILAVVLLLLIGIVAIFAGEGFWAAGTFVGAITGIFVIITDKLEGWKYKLVFAAFLVGIFGVR